MSLSSFRTSATPPREGAHRQGWIQRRLGHALGVAEQQVQRYESTDYRSASLARICDVAAALDVVIAETPELRDPNAA